MNIKEDLDNKGYKLLKPNSIFSEDILNKINNYIDKHFLNYKDIHTYNDFNLIYNKNYFSARGVIYKGFSKHQLLSDHKTIYLKNSPVKTY